MIWIALYVTGAMLTGLFLALMCEHEIDYHLHQNYVNGEKQLLVLSMMFWPIVTPLMLWMFFTNKQSRKLG